MKKKFLWPIVSVVAVLMLFVSAMFVYGVDRGLMPKYLGGFGSFVTSGFDRMFGVKTTQEEGANVSYENEHSMGVTDTGLLFAPKPAQSFRDATCDYTPTPAAPQEVGALGTSSWVIPRVHNNKLEPVSSTVSLSGFDNEPVRLPAAPDGITYAPGAQLQDTTGAVVQAGHVNYSDGKQLSPWGYLHKLSPCERVFEKDATGKTYEFVVTDLYTVPQHELEDAHDLWRRDGEKALYLITCSGTSVGDDGTREGNTLLFDYEYNLVVKAKPVNGQ